MKMLFPHKTSLLWSFYLQTPIQHFIYTLPKNKTLRAATLDLAVHVGDAAVTLGGSVELADLFNAEALGEGLPHAGAESVTHSQAHAVPALWRPHRLRQQVAADLADVLHHLEERKNIKQCERLYIRLQQTILIYYY